MKVLTVAEALAEPKRLFVDDPKFGAREQFWETDPVLWRNWQWAVTSYGIENVRGPYHYYIPKCAFDDWWPDHMAGKNWVDAEAFSECFAKAMEMHQ